MAYSFYSELKALNAKVAETDANFAVLIKGVYDGTGGEPDIRTVGNGGNVQNTAAGGASGAYTVPADLVFSTDTAGTSVLDFEIEKYDASTGEIVAWVQAGVNSGADVTFYMVYGDDGVTTSQESVAGAWDADFKMVHHLQGASAAALDDSTGNHDVAGSGGSPIYNQAGKIGSAVDFDGDGQVNIADSADFTLGTDSFTIEYWLNFNTVNANYHWTHRTANDGFYIRHDGTGSQFYAVAGGAVAIDVTGTGWTPGTGTWYHIVITRTGSTFAFYRDGSTDGTGSDASSVPAAAVSLYLGSYRSGVASFLDGLLDEVRLSRGIARSADYVTTTYNNQSSPSTFYSVGAEQLRTPRGIVGFQDPGIF